MNWIELLFICIQGEDGAEDDNDVDEDEGFYVPHGYLSDDEINEDDQEEVKKIIELCKWVVVEIPPYYH